jgi:hypothetical protein
VAEFGQQRRRQGEIGERLDGWQRGGDRRRQRELTLRRALSTSVTLRTAGSTGAAGGGGSEAAAAPLGTRIFGAGSGAGETIICTRAVQVEPSLMWHVSRNSRSE